ncbi:MAG: zf-HC2 domain-containing protein [Oscillospiraceae bacterium]|nr:zf-HC2 domain-containing protein [Oscillospiraceae bacterium]
MNLPCKVVEDLLPMYFDSLCSVESATLVEEHLKNCPACSHVLAQLQTEFEVSEKIVDDMKPLAAIQEKWQKSKRTNFKKGIGMTLAVLLVVITLLSGVWYFSYGKIFYNMARSMEPVMEGDTTISGANYKRELEDYRIGLWLPKIFSDDGYARVDGGDGLGLFLYPEAGGEYTWKLYITDEDGRTRFVYLNEDLAPDFENHDTLLSAEKEKEKVRKLVADEKEEISAVLEAVKVLWGIDLLEYTR